MKLMTKAIEAKLPKLYAQEGVDDPIVYVSLFSIKDNRRWLVTEGERLCNGDMELFSFGGEDPEWGYTRLGELERLRFGPNVPVVERDRFWKPMPMSLARKQVRI